MHFFMQCSPILFPNKKRKQLYLYISKCMSKKKITEGRIAIRKQFLHF